VFQEFDFAELPEYLSTLKVFHWPYPADPTGTTLNSHLGGVAGKPKCSRCKLIDKLWLIRELKE
jgi:hypothetical protein